MDECSRLVNAEKSEAEAEELSLRPQRLEEFVGQTQTVKNLRVFIQSALKRKQTLDHVLLAGPPGLGKTSLAHIIAREMGATIRCTSAPLLDKTDLASLLTGLETGDILFIDEIHRLAPAIEEILYPAMEDRTLDIVIGQGMAAKTIKIDLVPFTLIGATTRTGMLTSALRDRFGIPIRLDYYNPEELKTIALRSSSILNCKISGEAAWEIATRSRRTPRIVNRLLKRVADFATVRNCNPIDLDIARYSLQQLDIDELGLDLMDRRILRVIIDKYAGGPVGIKTIAASIGEDVDTLEDYYEPFLVQIGFINRTPRGRTATEAAGRHIGLEPGSGKGGPDDASLFD